MYKKWTAICQIPDAHFRMALALLDTNSRWGQEVISLFPSCFAEEEEMGPYPFSYLRLEANRDARQVGAGSDVYDELAVHGTCDRLKIPTFFFGQNDPIPPELAAQLMSHDDGSIGHVLNWDGKKVVVVDNALPLGVYLAPAELIDLDR